MTAFLCPKDPSHTDFQGLSYKRCEFAVDLHQDGRVIRETFRAAHEVLSTPADHEVVCVQCGAMVRDASSGLSFLPSAGMVLKCDFTRGFIKPEMTKVRPVVVISERRRNRDGVIVVGCSTGEPRDGRTISVKLPMAKYGFLFADNFAKCHMVYSVSPARLQPLDDRSGRLIDSRNTIIDGADLESIRAGVRQAIGLP